MIDIEEARRIEAASNPVDWIIYARNHFAEMLDEIERWRTKDAADRFYDTKASTPDTPADGAAGG